jgi:DnaB-like helicase C terminal domain
VALVSSIKIKTRTLESIFKEANSRSNLSGQPATLLTEKEDFWGVTLPISLRVRTRHGMAIANAICVSMSEVLKFQLSSGLSVSGTPSHKILKFVEGSGGEPEEWVSMKDFFCGQFVLTENGPLEILSIEKEPRQLVGDICVPGPHSYILENGVYSHNSILANQLNLNQASIGYKTALVPLEMSTPEMISRSASSISGSSSIDIFLKKLATGEKDQVWKRFTRFDRKVAKAGGRYTIFKPKEDLSIEELMAALHTFNSDVIYIDYITLLKGADGEDQWRKLGQISRFGKIYAENHNKVVVMLCQVSDDGRIRYSQAVKEHSSLAWIFVANKETKERGYLNIELLKSRNQVDRPFTLAADYAKMNVRDLQPEELKKIDSDKNSDKPKNTGKKSGKKGEKAGPTSKKGEASDYTPKDLTQDLRE